MHNYGAGEGLGFFRASGIAFSHVETRDRLTEIRRPIDAGSRVTGPTVIRTNRREINLSSHTHVIGVLNVTPDSFWDGGKFFDKQKAVDHAMSLVAAGADIVDVGGESTRPGAMAATESEEMHRVIPVIHAIRTQIETIISVDTYKANVARAAIAAGAEIVNDISGLAFDPMMRSVVSDAGVACVLTHNASDREKMHALCEDTDIVAAVNSDLREKVELAVTSKIGWDKIIIDPGIGFGKSTDDDLMLHSALRRTNYYNLPMLVASSRKKFIGNVLGLAAPERLAGTIASCIIALSHGATLLRVHDVKQVVEAARIFDAVTRRGMTETGISHRPIAGAPRSDR